ncbi:MAG: hypothetical protein ACLQVI_33735 [Polyangiaceae bacterium]|jgi:hypothetical protein
MVPQERADAIVRGTLALAEASYRVAHMRELLLVFPPNDLAPALEIACARAEQAEPRAREWLVSLVDAITGTEPELREAVQRLREEAAGESHLALERVLRAPPTLSPGVPDPNKARSPDYGKGRPLTLGERKSLARRPDREMMARLLHDPHPEVIRRLLGNPRLTEDDVVRLASKRPCRPDVIAEIARSEKWMHRARVRLSIVLNPSTPPEISAPVASLLMRQELKLVAETTAVPTVVRALCLEHLERRPPGDFDDDDARLQ